MERGEVPDLKFRLGKVPEDDGFEPQPPTWTHRGESSVQSVKLQLVVHNLLMIPFAIVFLVLWAWAIGGFSLHLDLTSWSPVLMIGVALGIALGLLAIMPLHELLHVAAMPGGWTSGKTVIGFWPPWAFYAHHAGEMTKRRYILVLLLPFLVMTVLPLLVMYVGLPRGNWDLLVLFPAFSGGGCLADILYAMWVLRRVPHGAIVRGKGHRLYWRAGGAEVEGA